MHWTHLISSDTLHARCTNKRPMVGWNLDICIFASHVRHDALCCDQQVSVSVISSPGLALSSLRYSIAVAKMTLYLSRHYSLELNMWIASLLPHDPGSTTLCHCIPHLPVPPSETDYMSFSESLWIMSSRGFYKGYRPTAGDASVTCHYPIKSTIIITDRHSRKYCTNIPQ